MRAFGRGTLAAALLLAAEPAGAARDYCFEVGTARTIALPDGRIGTLAILGPLGFPDKDRVLIADGSGHFLAASERLWGPLQIICSDAGTCEVIARSTGEVLTPDPATFGARHADAVVPRPSDPILCRIEDNPGLSTQEAWGFRSRALAAHERLGLDLRAAWHEPALTALILAVSALLAGLAAFIAYGALRPPPRGLGPALGWLLGELPLRALAVSTFGLLSFVPLAGMLSLYPWAACLALGALLGLAARRSRALWNLRRQS